MVIGIPKEIKNGETRVSMTPGFCRRVVSLGGEVLIEKNAGRSSGFRDHEYKEAGAKLKSAAAVWGEADLILKVKEPQEQEFERMRKKQTLFTYLHLAACPALAKVLCEKEVLGLAYESVEGPGGSHPLLQPMSQIAGRLAIQIGANLLQSQNGGSGVLLGGIPGTLPGHVVVIGAGNTGKQAVQMAVGMGARVTVLDLDQSKLDALDIEYHGRVVTLISNPVNLRQQVVTADLLVGAVLIPGTKAPIVIPKDYISKMRPGSAIVDVAIDQGGCIETIRATSHQKPTYKEYGVIHYAVPNMPALVGFSSTMALTQATEYWVTLIVKKGLNTALKEHQELAKGVNTREGRIVDEVVAKELGFEFSC